MWPETTWQDCLKGAQATALSIFLAKAGASKEEIRKEIEERFGYDLSRTVDAVRPTCRFDETCQGSVPESIIACLDSNSLEDAIRNAVSLGGDADTQACIAGGIAEAFYDGVPEDIAGEVRSRLPDEFLRVIDEFVAKYESGGPGQDGSPFHATKETQ